MQLIAQARGVLSDSLDAPGTSGPVKSFMVSSNFRLKQRSRMWNDIQRNILAVARNYWNLLFISLSIFILATMFESVGLGLLMPFFQTIKGIESNRVLTANAEWGFEGPRHQLDDIGFS